MHQRGAGETIWVKHAGDESLASCTLRVAAMQQPFARSFDFAITGISESLCSTESVPPPSSPFLPFPFPPPPFSPSSPSSLTSSLLLTFLPQHCSLSSPLIPIYLPPPPLMWGPLGAKNWALLLPRSMISRPCLPGRSCKAATGATCTTLPSSCHTSPFCIAS